MKRKYFTSKREAIQERDEKNKRFGMIYSVYKMPKGTRNAGKYAVCSYIEFLNTY